MNNKFPTLIDCMKHIFSKNFTGEYNHRSLTMPFDKNRVVKIEMAGTTSNHYTGCIVTLFSKTTGEIVRQLFNFNEHFTVASQTNKNSDIKGFCIVAHSGTTAEWHINIPTEDSYQDLCDAIDNWLAIWKIED